MLLLFLLLLASFGGGGRNMKLKIRSDSPIYQCSGSSHWYRDQIYIHCRTLKSQKAHTSVAPFREHFHILGQKCNFLGQIKQTYLVCRYFESS